MGSVLSAKHFHDEEAAYAFIEARVWANGRVCPHCGVVDKSGALKGASTRIGVYKCYACRKPFTVKVKTIFEDSHVKLHLWLQAIFLICSSKKGISANQLHRTLGVTLKTAWFMGHRIRLALESNDGNPFGSGGKTVEVDETFIGRDPSKPIRTGYEHKHKVLALIERETGRSKAMVVEKISGAALTPILVANIAREAHIMTDEAGQYYYLRDSFAKHDVINHGKEEYVRGAVHTNTVEGYFSVFKRGMRGTYQHCAKKHLHRYLAEFDFRYSNRVALNVNDTQRAEKALAGVVGKRLTYETIGQRA